MNTRYHTAYATQPCKEGLGTVPELSKKRSLVSEGSETFQEDVSFELGFEA